MSPKKELRFVALFPLHLFNIEVRKVHRPAMDSRGEWVAHNLRAWITTQTKNS